MYLYMKSRLGKEFNEPCGAPGWTWFWLINMFSACTCSDVMSKMTHVLKLFCLPESTLRIVIAIDPFGMDIDLFQE